MKLFRVTVAGEREKEERERVSELDYYLIEAPVAQSTLSLSNAADSLRIRSPFGVCLEVPNH